MEAINNIPKISNFKIDKNLKRCIYASTFLIKTQKMSHNKMDANIHHKVLFKVWLNSGRILV